MHNIIMRCICAVWRNIQLIKHNIQTEIIYYVLHNNIIQAMLYYLLLLLLFVVDLKVLKKIKFHHAVPL